MSHLQYWQTVGQYEYDQRESDDEAAAMRQMEADADNAFRKELEAKFPALLGWPGRTDK